MINTSSRQHVEICRDEAMRQLQDYCAVFIVPQRDKPKQAREYSGKLAA